MVICQLRRIVSDHFFRFTFEAHAFATSTAEYLVAAVDLHHRHAAVCIGTFSYSILSHVADKICVSLSDLNSLITSKTRMSDFLAAVAVDKFACGTVPD